ncbi:hypothetical protein IV203_035845 [Nitzschia inconspicua]|uniref:Uncharacterized protein n=1 Tax=Nitzschia inconspicua TaxID=303405 RepID=A0A9K3PVD8_9STRA|nr:hypothetical protein IV203_035845 [Nitzschia inconspicua]
MGFSTSSTITSATSILGTIDGFNTDKLLKTRQDQPSYDQVTYEENIEDESNLQPESEQGFKTVVRRLKRGIFCHAFWSLCFDDYDEDDITSRKPKDSIAPSLASLEQWQLQQRRDKRSWLELSSIDDTQTIFHRKKLQDEKGGMTKENKNGTPATILVAKVTAVDKYVAAGDQTYKVEDDVASEVSLDFSEPNQFIKGQRIKIKKKPPKTIKTTMKTKPKTEDSTLLGNSHESTTQTLEERSKYSGEGAKGSKDNVSKASSSTSSKSHRESRNAPFNKRGSDTVSMNEPKRTDVPFTEQSKVGGIVAPEKDLKTKSSQKDEKQPNDSLKNTSDRSKKKSEPLPAESVGSPPNDTTTTGSGKEIKEPCSKKMVIESTQGDQGEEDEEDGVLPKPRFIPDFSRRELKLCPVTSPPEQLIWKYAEESRWEYYGDPRKSRVDRWWKEETGGPRYDDQDFQKNSQSDDEDVYSGRLEQYYTYDSDSEKEDESYLERYSSGPSLASPEVAKERAERLARECSKPTGSTVLRLFGFGRRSGLSQTVIASEDDLDDFAEVNDLKLTLRSRYDTRYDEDFQDIPEIQSLPEESRDELPEGESDRNPVPPGVFHL